MGAMVPALDLVARLVLAFGLTYVLGFERELRGSPAGDRTFSLIGVAGAVIGILAVHGAPTALAGAVTGVGFIGAGLVFRQNEMRLTVLHGVTTAATIFAAVAIGAAAGYGQPAVAVAAALLVLLSLELRYVRWLRVFDARRYATRFRNDDDPTAQR
jgi:putative Mg2+ transporter-C (MgtC) family protein